MRHSSSTQSPHSLEPGSRCMKYWHKSGGGNGGGIGGGVIGGGGGGPGGGGGGPGGIMMIGCGVGGGTGGGSMKIGGGTKSYSVQMDRISGRYCCAHWFA